MNKEEYDVEKEMEEVCLKNKLNWCDVSERESIKAVGFLPLALNEILSFLERKEYNGYYILYFSDPKNKESTYGFKIYYEGGEKEPVEIVGEKEEVVLPKEGKLISSFINQIFPILCNENVLFYRRDIRQIVEVGKVKHKKDKEKFFTGFVPVKPSRFITLVEKFFIPGIEIYSKKSGRFMSEFRQKSMTKELANTILESYILEEELNQIDRIFTIPMPIIHHKKLTSPRLGYDKRFNSWLIPTAPKISNTEMTLEESKKILHNMIKEFCFQSNDDYNMAIASIITPFLRGLYTSFNCRTPVYIYKGNRERVGKDYLAGINGLIYEGVALEEPPLNNTENKGNSNEELRKKILSAFISGRKRLHFSNNKGYINNAVFESVITASTYSDRILGKNESPIFDNELEFSLSGNVGIGLTPDLVNRSRIINLFFDKEDANARIFKRPDLHKWVLDNRELVLSSIYGLIKNWFEKGCPDGIKKFSSFPEWARVCGGIMESAGYESPCKSTIEDLSVGMDSETRDMKLLFECCYETKPNKGLSKHDIKNIIDKEEIFSYYDFEKKSDQVRFGNKILKFVGRILSDIKMSVVDKSIRTSRQKYIFTKEVRSYDKELVNNSKELVNNSKEEVYKSKEEVNNSKEGEVFLGGDNENNEKSGNLGNLGNLLPTVKQKQISLYNTIGNTLPTLPTLPHFGDNLDNFDEKGVEIVKIGNLGNLEGVDERKKEIDFSELKLEYDKKDLGDKNG